MPSIAHKALAVVAGLGGIVGIRSGTPEPPFSVVERIGAIEIRSYGERLAAETQVRGSVVASRSAGFQRVAGFIFGANSGKARIAMTAPVAQAKAAPDAFTIRFFMPAEWTRPRLPRPNDPSVRIVTVPAQTMAVLTFSGSTAAEVMAAKQASLLAALATTRWHPCGEPVAWFYDPPWTLPPLRRNEVAVCVEKG